jgi:hypothetical protein
MLKRISFVFVFIFLIASLASAQTLISDKDVKYDKEIQILFDSIENKTVLDSFLEEDYANKNKSELKNFYEKNLKDDKVYIIATINDQSGIVYNGTKDERHEQWVIQNQWYQNEINNVIKSLSENDFILYKKGAVSFSGLISEEGFEKMKQREDIKAIELNSFGKSTVAESIPLINADYAQQVLGYTGEGVSVCIIDSGLVDSWDIIFNNIEDEYCYCDHDWIIPGGCCPNDGETDTSARDDESGHGTLNAGIVAANQNAQNVGVAPDANLYLIKIMDNNLVFGDDYYTNGDLESAISQCISWGVDVISLSGGGYDSDCSISNIDTVLGQVANNGIVFIASSGNGGHTDRIMYPACHNEVISVGAVYDTYFGREPDSGKYSGANCYDANAQTGSLVCFTDRSSELDLLAPGYINIVYVPALSEGIGMGGTSQAAPHVAGAAALLLQKNPALTPNQILTTLQNTGVPVGSWKRIDVEAALNSIEAPCNCGSWGFSGSCGTGGCSASQKPQTRSCTPDLCQFETQCVYDASCETPSSETSDCTESGYEYCWEYESGDCTVSLAVNMYENVNNIQWGAVNDAWDPYVIGEYTFGWKDVDAEHMYYSDDIEETCDYGGCESESEVNGEDTMVTATAPSIADRETILAYDDTDSYACWLWNPTSTSFRPNYGESNPIYVLNCFSNNDCSANQYCDKSGSWSSWSCVNKKSNGQSCNSASDCSSGYCDNDGVGLSDDGWCFTPYNTYFDGQENTKCEISTGYGISDCDERSVGDDLNKCIGVAYSEEECSSSCSSIDVTSVFECGDTGCSCSQPLCDGLTTGNNITNCSGGETYFADKCTASAEGEDRNDSICRSSSFASGCTADAGCNSIAAGVGNCNLSCKYISDIPPTVTLVSPSDNSIDTDGNVIFNCSATDDKNLINITLYGNWSGSWVANETKSLTGISNSTIFTKNISNGFYKWNCRVFDNSSQIDWGDTNYTLIINLNASTTNLYYKRVNISEKSGKNLTSYSIQINNFNCENKCNNTGKDIRITYNNLTQIPFGLQQTNSSFYNITFRVNLLANKFNDSIYIWYGNLTANYANSSWNNIRYDVYDDFSTNTLNVNWICVDDTCSYNSTSQRMRIDSGGVAQSAIVTYNKSSFDNIFAEADLIQISTYDANGWSGFETSTSKTASTGLLTRSMANINTGVIWLYNGTDTINIKSNSNWTTINPLNATYFNFSSSQTEMTISAGNASGKVNSTIISDTMYMRIHSRDKVMEFDNFRVRNYTSPEPTYTISNQFNSSNGSSGTWWNASWAKKKEIKIQEKSNKIQVNYSVLLTIPYDSYMNASFKDLRFTNGSENTQLKYYIESQTNSSIANVWVLIPNLAPNVNTTIYMYYGNPTATSNSNRNEAFLLFENFDTDPFTGTRGWNCWDATCTYDSTNKWVNLSAGSGFASAIMSYNLSNYSNVEIKFQEFGLNAAYWFALETRSAQSGGGVINQRYYGHTTPAIQTITGSAWAVSSSFLSKSNYTVAWYNFSSTVTTQNYTAKNETRLENTTAGSGYGVQDNSYINFHGRSSSQIAIDDVRVRRYTLPEPSYYIGGEESY